MLPVVPGDLVQTFHNIRVAHLDRQLAPAVEAPAGKVDGADDCGGPVSEHHLAVQPQVLELMDFDADVVHDPQAADALDELVALQRVGRTHHDVHLHAPLSRAYQVLDDHHVLEALVLDEQPVPGLVDESADLASPWPRTPDEMTRAERSKRVTMPVGLEALDDLRYIL